jgi:hypothetical protein
MIRLSLGLTAAAAAMGLVAAPATAAVVDFSSLTQWKVEDGGNGHFYALTDVSSTWTDAYAAATGAGGDLVSVASADENSFLTTAFGFDRTPDTIFWIGLRRMAPGGAFGWTDGSALTYTNWNPGEPNNAGGTESYTAINWYAGNGRGSALGTWNDTPDAGVLYGNPTPQPNRGIVEFASRPMGAVPEPATWALMIMGFGLAGATFRRRRAVACG